MVKKCGGLIELITVNKLILSEMHLSFVICGNYQNHVMILNGSLLVESLIRVMY